MQSFRINDQKQLYELKSFNRMMCFYCKIVTVFPMRTKDSVLIIKKKNKLYLVSSSFLVKMQRMYYRII